MSDLPPEREQGRASGAAVRGEPVNTPATDWRSAQQDARQHLAQARSLAASTIDAQNAALNALEIAIEGALKEGLNTLPSSDIPITAHRRAHKPGRAPKIASDPELQAFIRARIARMTYIEIADDIAAHFPKPRHVGKSTIHKWWRNERPQN